ncbi:MAG: homogentisate 1,2-dioxygenase [Nocardioidaceae bacterium]|nr:homogentisate 1,2-dioxygenase [Nocardioidaceae bacterium]
MAHYHLQGSVPPKRHTQFRQPDGSLYHEEIFSVAGFSGISSLLYHTSAPAQASHFRVVEGTELKEHDAGALTPHAYRCDALVSDGSAIEARRPLLFNDTVVVSFATTDVSMSDFYRNGLADELVLVQSGSGTLHTQFGALRFGPEELVLIPRGTIVQWELDGPTRMLVVETSDPLEIPSGLRNEFGQMLERAMFCERDLRLPELGEPTVERGPHLVQVKHGTKVTEVTLDEHPFDVVGWDGYVYPHVLPLADIEPITGSLHQMPDVYQILATAGAAICVIPPHPLDYHPLAVPSPPHHTNVDSDEVMFLVSGTVPGRKAGATGQLTFHPRGLTHGPKAGGYEASVGATHTDMTAFMIDTFQTLRPTTNAVEIEDPEYYREWLVH